MPKQRKSPTKEVRLQQFICLPAVVFFSVLLSPFEQYVKGFQRPHIGEDVRPVTRYSFYYEDFVM